MKQERRKDGDAEAAGAEALALAEASGDVTAERRRSVGALTSEALAKGGSAAEGLERATADELVGLALFEGLDRKVAEWIAEHSVALTVEAGDSLVDERDVPDAMFIPVSGALQFRFMRGERVTSVIPIEVGKATALLPYSRMTHFPGRAVALEKSRLVRVGREDFADMVHMSPELGQRLVALMSDRVRTTTRSQEDEERLMSLGRLSAGLAHELNNPAAAVRRSVSLLRERLSNLPSLVARLSAHQLSEDDVCAVDSLRAGAGTAMVGARLSSVERSEREDELGEWLDTRNVGESWMRAESLVDAGIAAGDLDALGDRIPAGAFPDVIAWLEGGLTADRLLREIESAAARISELVASIKTYSHMDRAQDSQAVVVREGLDSTLTMLGHKLKTRNIDVERDYGDDDLEVQGYPGELNQVWTNLIDNAIDAMDDGGKLTVAVAAEGDESVLVRIIDNGHGIPPEIQARIFEPFFTTKDVGDGSGLGLDIVDRIIRNLHEGSVDIASEPGHTEFTIRLRQAK